MICSPYIMRASERAKLPISVEYDRVYDMWWVHGPVAFDDDDFGDCYIAQEATQFYLRLVSKLSTPPTASPAVSSQDGGEPAAACADASSPGAS